MRANLRHLRAFLAVFDTGSITRASAMCHVSQPAVTQAIRKLERQAEAELFQRTSHGLFATPAGTVLALRVRTAFRLLDPALAELAPRLRITATAAQLTALIAVTETENFTLAARRLGLAQPTVHRAITDLEQEIGRSLFERTAHGMIATRAAELLTRAAQLAFAELDQGEADLGELLGREVGRIVVGAMPLSRSLILPRAIARFRQQRPTLPIQALDGPYADLITGLRRGEVDFLIGAMRDPAPIGDIVQQALFDDELVVVCGRHHPLLTQPSVQLAQLAAYPWVVAVEGTPTRQQFNQLFAPDSSTRPISLIETGSMVLMRELLQISDHLGFISGLQIESDIKLGAVARLPLRLGDTSRSIGLTVRAGWTPTRAQDEFLQALRATVADLGP
ncbi:LysR family transcriptional regulator [Devosia sp.]|uniref:LysR family transcriptional regulator n=1 Tax=Devosia sp. TaxID=1871048 RepID=UPI0027357F80|nr:LysR family transcriptional regulator [Devosia sp.]MDP2781323.1 LysR family transcriptional regulator [Devosia sp.]